MQIMNSTRLLQNVGQSLWLDNITSDLLNSGALRRYILEFSVTGLTSNPTIFDNAIKNSHSYDEAIIEGMKAGKSSDALSFDLMLNDITRAADLFRPIYERTNGVDGWVSLEISPLLAYDTASTLTAAKELFSRAGRSNLFIKIPGTKEGLPAIEEAIFTGIPVNVTLLFSREHYLGAAEAFLRGIERRIEAGLNPRVASVASVFVSRWDTAVAGKVPASLENQLGPAVARQTYQAYAGQLASPRWQRIFNEGAVAQRLLWASTGTKDPKASDTLYVTSLAAPYTVNTMPEPTLNAFANHGQVGPIMRADGGNSEDVLTQFNQAGIRTESLGARLQQEGAASFVKSWNELVAVIRSKGLQLVG
jgi:transaldolase